MKAQDVVKSQIAKVFPLMGSTEDGKNRIVRVAKEQPYSMAIVGIRLTPSEVSPLVIALLNAEQEAKDIKNAVIDVTARRSGSTVAVQVTTEKPVKANGHAKKASASSNSHGRSTRKAKTAKRARHAKKSPASAPAPATDSTEAA